MESFGKTYQALAAGKLIAASDHLNKMSPFIDDQNLMRIKGRLRHSDAGYEIKHPILLSAKHPIVRNLTGDAHKSNYMKERSTFAALYSKITGYLDFETCSEM